MSDSSHFIAQIKEQEEKSAEMLKQTESDNDLRIAEAKKESDDLIANIETQAKEEAKDKIQSAKEAAKEDYKKMLVDGDNARRDVVEKGEDNLKKGVAHVLSAFDKMFSS